MSVSTGRVLIVDDDPFVREFTETLINRERPETIVVGCASAADGLNAAKHHKPDLVLLDLTMPEMDGYEAAPRLRQILGPTVPIIILTGDGIDGHDSLLESIGANGIISKPFDPESFITQLQYYEQIDAIDKDSDKFEKRFSEISASYETHLAKVLTSLTQIRSSLGKSNDVAGVLLELREISHQLAGSAGQFQFDAVGEAADRVETTIPKSREIMQTAQDFEQVLLALDQLIDHLAAAVGRNV